MGVKRLSGVSVSRNTGRYIPALHAALKSANYFDGPEYRLGGMTGMSFKFISHRRMLAPAVFMYPLQRHTWNAVERLGIYSEVYSGYKNSPTFQLYQRKAIERARESIDRGIPAVFWEPNGIGFAVINGYDDEDEIFLYQDRAHDEDQILMYSNVGKVGAASWLIQVFGERAEKDIRDIYLDSMECCVDEWEISDNVALLVKSEFGSGRKAYDYTIDAFEEGSFSEIGALAILNNAIVTKEQTCHYFQEVKNEFNTLKEIAKRYQNVSELFMKIGEIIPRRIDHDGRIDRTKMPGLIQYLREAQVEEEKAVHELKAFLKEDLHNRHVDYYDIKKFV